MSLELTEPIREQASERDDVASVDPLRLTVGASLWTNDKALRLAFAAGFLTLLVVVPTTAYRIAEAGYLNNVSGVWATLADDLSHGVLYRPLVSELGYGGTRYFPLHIVLHAALAWLGVPLIVAGHLISLAAGGLLVGGAYLVLRNAGTPWRVALCLAPVVLVSRTVFIGLANIRGDLLPVALALLGLGLCPKDDRESPVPAGIVMGLALLAKQTVVWAPWGAFVALLAAGQQRNALRFAGIAGSTCVLGLGLAQWISGGEMWASFRAFSTGGTISLKKLYITIQYFRPGEMIWIAGGFVLCAARWRESLRNPARAAMLFVVPLTIAVFASDGTHVNHLVDASAMGALTVMLCCAVGTRWKHRLLTLGVVAGLIEASALHGMELRRGELRAAAAALPPGEDPVLSDQPWIPLLAGERPFLLDSFNIAQKNLWGDRIRSDLLARVDRCAFRAVVLSFRADLIYDQLFFRGRFGPGFQEHLLQHYAISHVTGAHAFYLPRCGKPDAPPPPAASLAETMGDRWTKSGLLRGFLQKLFPPDT